jgi:starvation-inducible outer membrane lipoprotein
MGVKETQMKSLIKVLLLSLISSGCSYQVFPSDVLNGVDHNFDFARWRMVPNQIQSTKVELGGRIVETQTIGRTITIIAQELPIVRYPAYGPKQGKSKGEFVISYQGEVDKPFLHPGNRIMVVGITRGAKMVPVDDVVRSLPMIEANCIHIWKTGDTDIADYASSGAGYGVLEEETFCASTTTSPPSRKIPT